MSQKEADRLHVMKLLLNKDITQKMAANMMGLSRIQTIRIKKSYIRFGVKGLISKRRGLPSPNKISEIVLKNAIDIVNRKYFDFGPTFACEKLLENHNIKLSVETVRKLMIKHGLWKSRKYKNIVVHQMRTRRSRFGELIQIDGSYHRWFEDRADKCCLLVFIDDSTSKITAAKFCVHESKESYFDILTDHIVRYGKPLALYADKWSAFKVNNKKFHKGDEITHFASSLKSLDIDLICANSPQAKGRVERANGVLQDRLIKEMRLKNISSIREGNEFLKEYLQKHNDKFCKEPLCPEDAHRALKEDLSEAYALKEKRKLSKNLTFQYENELYQICPQIASHRMRHAGVTVIKKEQNIEVFYKGIKLPFKKHCFTESQGRIVDRKHIDAWINKKARKVYKNHPWR